MYGIMTTRNISDFYSQSDSVSLKEIDGQKFTIVAVEQSNYDETLGVKLTTKESFQVKGKSETLDGINKFHTTRKAIVNLLLSDGVRDSLLKGEEIGQVKVILQKSQTKGGKDYYTLVEA